MIIELDGISIEITRKQVKNMHLRIYPPDGLVKVSVPLKFSEQLIRQTLQTKGAWIHQQRERIRSRSVIESSELETGATVVFKGKQYLLIVEEHHGPEQIKINDELMYCYTQPNSSHEQKQKLLDNWYRYQMQILLPDLIRYWESVVGVKVSQWGIKKMKTRWGSCNTKVARIWLNLNLIKKPQICMEYVLVHELVHLLEPSHNKRFYQLMSKFMPEWRQYEFLLEGRAP
ncbi:M48 family metallopeptidase [Legionella longbeachae]|uniref:Putative zinc metalloprotease n=1 Tax=Legionella longbeachae serogroup 1 (strain NSW150) TaxID=661367 RepID=D3HLE6_LEGLN|nr:SprT family zinc-dependent metalloprotease [Legionella longbeachae]VEE03770.1 zinc metalloprotease [Legionella oakridgensis]HBD7397427.1 M48 family metallopeptidase [Legionella pneumophila]ARB93353.1 M48 family peptidase [Legionella longbeachae]ARM33543.1 M48 family metallopeptidase [Legionella longbeachae]EEZ93599.1 zinc metalloprotease [Legionella longbeachae D-4968]